MAMELNYDAAVEVGFAEDLRHSDVAHCWTLSRIPRYLPSDPSDSPPAGLLAEDRNLASSLLQSPLLAA